MMMKGLLLFTLTMVGSVAFGQHAEKNVPSPDGKYAVEVGAKVQIVAASGATVCMLQDNPGLIQGAEAKWSSDSKRVVIITQYPIGNFQYDVINDGSEWLKTSVSVDNQFPDAQLRKEAGVSGYVKAQHEHIGEWLDDHRVTINGTASYFDKGSVKAVPYGYTLVFSDGPSSGKTRGGYEKGLVKAIDWHVRK